MDYIEVVIEAEQGALEDVAARLLLCGISQVEILDGKDEIERFLKQGEQYWDLADAGELTADRPPSGVRFYLADDAELDGTLESVKNEFAPLIPATRRVREEDWANNWKQYYKPLEIGERLLIKPSWEEISSDGGRVVLELDPGMAFGTGTHETTQLCLELLEPIVGSDTFLLDLGCGSGILSIAAKLLGASRVAGVDVDANALDVARENALRNGISAEDYPLHHGDAARDAALRARVGAGCDIVVANIIADVIIALGGVVRGFLKPDGVFIASGIIKERACEVADALKAHGLTLMQELSRGEWVALLFRT